MSFLGFVEFAESYDVWVVEHLEDLGLPQGLLFLSFAHIGNVNLLDHAEVSVALALDQICLAKGSLTQQLLLLVNFEEGSGVVSRCLRVVRALHH